MFATDRRRVKTTLTWDHDVGPVVDVLGTFPTHVTSSGDVDISSSVRAYGKSLAEALSRVSPLASNGKHCLLQYNYTSFPKIGARLWGEYECIISLRCRLGQKKNAKLGGLSTPCPMTLQVGQRRASNTLEIIPKSNITHTGHIRYEGDLSVVQLSTSQRLSIYNYVIKSGVLVPIASVREHAASLVDVGACVHPKDVENIMTLAKKDLRSMKTASDIAAIQASFPKDIFQQTPGPTQRLFVALLRAALEDDDFHWIVKFRPVHLGEVTGVSQHFLLTLMKSSVILDSVQDRTSVVTDVEFRKLAAHNLTSGTIPESLVSLGDLSSVASSVREFIFLVSPVDPRVKFDSSSHVYARCVDNVVVPNVTLLCSLLIPVEHSFGGIDTRRKHMWKGVQLEDGMKAILLGRALQDNTVLRDKAWPHMKIHIQSMVSAGVSPSRLVVLNQPLMGSLGGHDWAGCPDLVYTDENGAYHVQEWKRSQVPNHTL